VATEAQEPRGRHFKGTRAPSYPATAASRQMLDTPRAEANMRITTRRLQ
jgi:hypothetical protein